MSVFCWHHHNKMQEGIEKGLLRELNPGRLAPEARIIPLDQAAIVMGGENVYQDLCSQIQACFECISMHGQIGSVATCGMLVHFQTFWVHEFEWSIDMQYYLLISNTGYW